MQLRTIDAQALANLNRALIGFDRIFSDVENRFANTVQTNYPPYNILKHSENNFEIEIAVAGFEKSDITVEVDQDQLIVRGQRTKDEDTSKYLHRGLAARDFERSWTLAEHMEVSEVELTNGILRVKITRIVPEELKPRLIPIK
jgi:molecular chaperone IbpA